MTTEGQGMHKREPKKHNVKFIIFHFNLCVVTKKYNIKNIYKSYIVSLSLSYEACLWTSRVSILLPFLPSGALCATLKTTQTVLRISTCQWKKPQSRHFATAQLALMERRMVNMSKSENPIPALDFLLADLYLYNPIILRSMCEASC